MRAHRHGQTLRHAHAYTQTRTLPRDTHRGTTSSFIYDRGLKAWWTACMVLPTYPTCLDCRDSTPEEATDDVINVHLPEVGRLRDTGHVDVDGVDVFCEQGVFSVDQARRILEAGMNGLGLEGNFHGEELHCLNSAEVSHYVV